MRRERRREGLVERREIDGRRGRSKRGDAMKDIWKEGHFTKTYIYTNDLQNPKVLPPPKLNDYISEIQTNQKQSKTTGERREKCRKRKVGREETAKAKQKYEEKRREWRRKERRQEEDGR